MKIQKLHESSVSLSKISKNELTERLMELSDRGLIHIREKYGRITDVEINHDVEHKDTNDPIIFALMQSAHRSDYGRNFSITRSIKQPTKKQMEVQSNGTSQPANDGGTNTTDGGIQQGNTEAPVSSVSPSGGELPSAGMPES